MTATLEPQVGRNLPLDPSTVISCDDGILSQLTVHSQWDSFDRFKREGARALDSLVEHQIAEIATKHDRYIVMRRESFNCLFGLASEVYRLSQTFTSVRLAVQVAMKHPKDGTVLQLLSNIVFQQPLLRTQERPQRPPIEFDGDVGDDEVQADDSLSLDAPPSRPAFRDVLS